MRSGSSSSAPSTAAYEAARAPAHPRRSRRPHHPPRARELPLVSAAASRVPQRALIGAQRRAGRARRWPGSPSALELATSASAAERRPHDRPARTHPEQPGLGRPGRVIAGLIRAYDIAGKRGLRVTQKVQRALARSSTAKFRPPRSWTTRPSSTAQPGWPGARKRRVADSTTSRSRSLARRNDELNRPRQVILSAP
jgi:hypothetical protein